MKMWTALQARHAAFEDFPAGGETYVTFCKGQLCSRSYPSACNILGSAWEPLILSEDVPSRGANDPECQAAMPWAKRSVARMIHALFRGSHRIGACKRHLRAIRYVI